MIVVNVEVVTDAGAADGLRDVVRNMEQATRAESGCLKYVFSVDVSDPAMVRVTEWWESLDAIRGHLASPHMAEFQRAVGALKPKSVDIKAFEVAREVSLG
jgi:quinol monooxygenase YgiN